MKFIAIMVLVLAFMVLVYMFNLVEKYTQEKKERGMYLDTHNEFSGGFVYEHIVYENTEIINRYRRD